MPYVEVTRVLPAPQEEIYRVLADMSRFPEFMPDVLSVEIQEREGNRAESAWVTRLKGSTFRWVEEDIFDEESGRIRYRLLRGDLRRFEGEWILMPAARGTAVTLTVDFEFGIPMLAGLLNPVAKIMIEKNVTGMLEGLERALTSTGPGGR